MIMTMKRVITGILGLLLVVLLFNSCKKEVVTAPPTPEKVEKVEEVQPKVEKPQLTEEELFQRRTLEEINKMGYLKRIHFDFDKYDIRDDMKPILEQNAKWLSAHPTVVVTIDGHCDERGTEEYNMALGEKRANAAKRYLMNLGVPGENMKTVSYGKTKPLVKGVDEESFYMNRRDEFTIIKK
jgi:peptidoglycan-associated lipoprotein